MDRQQRLFLLQSWRPARCDLCDGRRCWASPQLQQGKERTVRGLWLCCVSSGVNEITRSPFVRKTEIAFWVIFW